MYKLIFAVVMMATMFSSTEENIFLTNSARPTIARYGIISLYYVFECNNVYLQNCGDEIFLKPAAVFKNKPQAPTGVELKKEWLINIYQHPDSVVTAEEETLPTKFFWKEFIPKYQDSKKILVGKYSSADSSCQEFKWQEIPGQKKISVWLIIAIPMLFVTSLLSGLSLRLKNNKVAVAAVATMAVAAIAVAAIIMAPVVMVMTPAVIMPAIMIIIAAAATIMVVTLMVAMAKNHLKISAIWALFLVTIFVICIASLTKSFSVFIILEVMVAIIFFVAWKVGLVK